MIHVNFDNIAEFNEGVDFIRDIVNTINIGAEVSLNGMLASRIVPHVKGKFDNINDNELVAEVNRRVISRMPVEMQELAWKLLNEIMGT